MRKLSIRMTINEHPAAVASTFSDEFHVRSAKYLPIPAVISSSLCNGCMSAVWKLTAPSGSADAFGHKRPTGHTAIELLARVHTHWQFLDFVRTCKGGQCEFTFRGRVVIVVIPVTLAICRVSAVTSIALKGLPTGVAVAAMMPVAVSVRSAVSGGVPLP